MTRALHLPEILSTISEHLDRDDLTVCVRVCRRFYNAFISLIWDDIILDEAMPFLLMEPAILRAHAEYVHELRISGAIDVEYYDIYFENLRCLAVDAVNEPLNIPKVSTDSYNDDNEHRFLASFIRQHATIERLFLCEIYNQDLPYSFWGDIRFRNPKVLTLGELTVNNGFVDYFWWTCARFEELNFYGMTLPLHNMPSRLCFQDAKKLSLSLTSSSDTEQPHNNSGVLEQLELIKKFPELETLSWSLRGANQRFPAQEFQWSIKNGVWSKLESLCLYGDWSDCTRGFEEVQEVPSSLKALKVVNYWIQPPVFSRVLDQISMTVVSLILQSVYGYTSAMAQDIMTRCPCLKVLKLTFVSIEDIVQSPSRPWVCTQLEVLQITLVKSNGTPLAWEQLVFERLSRLTRLKSLVLYSYTSKDYPYPPAVRQAIDEGRTLDLRLEVGLGALSTLTELELLEWGPNLQMMGMEEVEWMLMHWKKLSAVRGKVSGDPDRNQELRAALKGAGIFTTI
ncbi:hypothetical protein BGZ51_008317 [Haplosporangium sp. Z 767]|nr:hypothetical protein BGZ51_008317 [Haplosporangium sp. Z 767]KAF9192053.1 hypothetical protein BGZ50_008889 [Haplosporangium sp. Z 11]